MTNFNQNRYFIAPTLGYNTAGNSGRRGNLGAQAGTAANEFSSVLEETMAGSTAVAAPTVSNIYPAHLANTAYWSHPSYSQAMRKAC